MIVIPHEIKITLQINNKLQYERLFEETKEIFRNLCENSNPEQFFTSFYTKVVKDAHKLIQFCHHPLCVLVATRLAEKLLDYYKNSLSQNLDNAKKVTKITEREKWEDSNI